MLSELQTCKGQFRPNLARHRQRKREKQRPLCFVPCSTLLKRIEMIAHIEPGPNTAYIIALTLIIKLFK